MDFCARMCGQLLLSEVQTGSDQNIVVSPLSFHAILNMIAVGATGNTLEQMLSFLGCSSVADVKTKFSEMMDIAFDDKDGGGPVVSLVNGVWIDKNFPLTDSYVKFVKRFCKAEAKNVDFATQASKVVEEANLWAENETRGLVKDVLEENDITPTTICLLGNALYFKGAWKENFESKFTTKKNFYLLNGEKVSASFMTGCKNYLYGCFDGFQVVKIPYEMGTQSNKEFAMYILLPNKKDGLGTLLEKVESDLGFFGQDFHLWNKSLDDFWIPKFKFSYKTKQARDKMQEMGLTLAFSEGCRELTEIVDNGGEIPFYFSMIVQKALIEVDEKGTEAAAVTFAMMAYGCCPMQKRSRTEFVADHPFLFLVREECSRLVLFSGAVLNPCLGE